MKNQDYHKSFTATTTAQEAFNNIARVGDWWTNSFKGSAEKPGDTFHVKMGDTTVDFKVTEVVPGKRAVWLVIDCYLHWLNNKTEWTNTQLVWELTEDKNGVKVDMTHIGLTPDVECYGACEAGWNQYIGDSLPNLITTGKGNIFEGSRG